MFTRTNTEVTSLQEKINFILTCAHAHYDKILISNTHIMRFLLVIKTWRETACTHSTQVQMPNDFCGWLKSEVPETEVKNNSSECSTSEKIQLSSSS